MKIKRVLTQNLLLIIALLAAFISYLSYEQESPNRVIFLDVGQGDAALIQSEELNILVDGGPSSEIIYKLDSYLKPFDREIDYIVLTHPHADHMAGLLEVIERYKVGHLIINPVCYKSELYKALLERVDTSIVAAPEALEDASTTNLQFNIVWPIEEEGTANTTSPDSTENIDFTCPIGETGNEPNFDENLNNDSIVFELDTPSSDFLFMGDAELEVESALLQSGFSEDINILKAGHHCSKTSNSESWLLQVKPEMVICSVGKGNDYGHPSKEVIERFKKLGISYKITYNEGDIMVNF
ncbi:MAG: ComEC/Rec2 family competence protein [Candidatus Dojkabacteria bacterium]